jgi:hypothetical protein
MRTKLQQDKLDFLFNLKYGTNFNVEAYGNDELCCALEQHTGDIMDNYLSPRVVKLLDKYNFTYSDSGENTGYWEFSTTDKNSPVKKLSNSFWQNGIQKVQDLSWIIGYIEPTDMQPNDETLYGPHFFMSSRLEADRYLRYLSKVFRHKLNPKKNNPDYYMNREIQFY